MDVITLQRKKNISEEDSMSSMSWDSACIHLCSNATLAFEAFDMGDGPVGLRQSKDKRRTSQTVEKHIVNLTVEGVVLCTLILENAS